ncbi:MAG: hypothetical protein JWN25_2640 [Verrucomicrobiales bacterium]|nr:hypothetical protein [Verrucomicrobiales bacterium]
MGDSTFCAVNSKLGHLMGPPLLWAITMKNTNWFLLSIAATMVAIIFHSVEYTLVFQRLEWVSKIPSLDSSQRETARGKAESALRPITMVGRVGNAFLFASILLVGLALHRRERGWYSIPIMLILSDILIQMLA